jgi:hypothetical protein
VKAVMPQADPHWEGWGHGHGAGAHAAAAHEPGESGTRSA